MTKKSSEEIIERKINYSVLELESMGIRIFLSNVNRLQDERLISTFKTHLLSGGKYQTPGKLVNAKECIKAGRVLYRSYKVSGKKTLRVAEIKDFTPAELNDYNNGRCLVVFDGNHRYNAMLRAIELATSPEQVKLIKGSVFFNYENIPESQLSEVFLEINTQINTIDNQDYVPYILKNHGGKSDLYEFEYALDACQRAKYTGEKDRGGLFNYTGSLLICTGGIRPRAYNDKTSLFNLAKRGKEGMELPSECKSADAFKKYILVPYLFEKNLGPLNRIDHDLIFKNNLRFMYRLLVIDSTSPETTVVFTKFLTENSEEGRKFLRDYRLCRTIRGKDGREVYSSNIQRNVMFNNKWNEFNSESHSVPIKDIFRDIEDSFMSEVQSLREKEESYKRGNKGSYTANHNKLIAASKLSVVAM